MILLIALIIFFIICKLFIREDESRKYKKGLKKEYL